jgi:hypothetical protein
MTLFYMAPLKCILNSCDSLEFRELSRISNEKIEEIFWECCRCESIQSIKRNLEIEDNAKKAHKQKLTRYPSGATRSSDAEKFRYDLCPPIWQKSDAKIMAEGAITHGDNNWKLGIPIEVCLNHLEGHLNLWKSGDRSEDHLAKIRINAGFIMWFDEEEKKKNNEHQSQ